MNKKDGKYHVGFITSDSETLKDYYPTPSEPHLIPKELPFTPDDQIAVDFLRGKGFEVSYFQWGQDIEKLKKFDLVIMRSPWDYSHSDESIHKFIKWLDCLKSEDVKIENSPHFMRWLIDKSYLLDLEEAGVPIVSSKLVKDIDLVQTYASCGAFILKASISAAGRNLFLIDSAQKAEELQPEYNELCKNKTFILQPYIEEIKTHGEWSLVFIDGIYSHAVHKKPAPDSILVQAEKGGSVSFSDPPSDIIEFAQNNLPKITSSYNPLYLRIDIILTNKGPLLSECEGVEPEVFFRASEKSMELFYSN
ncbi:MAG: hypothetical protein A2Y25_00855 [Candidatus Melainabacteria bacterium GWF2_37_15]|nr:MAG: hypothetical protein A2Y25_00855 [Candidatus Melainabacteria bacterium GWF2_37_15]